MVKASCIVGFVLAAGIIGFCLLYVYWRKVKPLFDRCYKIMLWIVSVAGSVFMICIAYESRSIIKCFFDSYNSVFTGIGYTAVAIGLPYTILEVTEVKKQRQATLSYEIHKDSQRLIETLDEEVIDFIYEARQFEEVPESMRELVNQAISRTLRWYAGIYVQRSFGYVVSRQWKVIENNFFSFLGRGAVRNYWDNEVADNPSWSLEFREWGMKFYQQTRR